MLDCCPGLTRLLSTGTGRFEIQTSRPIARRCVRHSLPYHISPFHKIPYKQSHAKRPENETAHVLDLQNAFPHATVPSGSGSGERWRKRALSLESELADLRAKYDSEQIGASVFFFTFVSSASPSSGKRRCTYMHVLLLLV